MKIKIVNKKNVKTPVMACPYLVSE